jgi:RNA polymerase sigma factor (TIGR02999 family)
MPEAPSADQLTQILADASGGNVEALNRCFPLVYDELRRLAHSRLRSENDGHTLNTTALVHEAYMRLVDQTRVQWQGRAHFFAIASRAMRRILINHAEARRAAKRGGAVPHESLSEMTIALDDDHLENLLALDQALLRLKAFNERGADVVEYRFFGGLTYEEIAEVMGTSAITVRRAWTVSKSWLHRELGEGVLA